MQTTGGQCQHDVHSLIQSTSLKIEIPKDIQGKNLYRFINTEYNLVKGKASMMYMDGYTLNNTKYVINKNSKTHSIKNFTQVRIYKIQTTEGQ
jgi:hypothetical protein